MANIDEKKYIDLFSGCGGLSLGLHLAGWKGIFAVEKSPFAFKTLKHNLIDNRRHFEWPEWLDCREHDILDVLTEHRQNLFSLNGKVDLVAGGPPCQGFSMAGKRVEGDIRNKLVYSYIEFIKIVKPKLILFENVKGFTYAFNKDRDHAARPYSNIVIDKLKSIGYDIKAEIIDFSNFGVPQRRKRFILIGSLNGNASDFIEKINSMKDIFFRSKGISSRNNVKDAISDLLQVNGVVPCPDRVNFTAGRYASSYSRYQRMMRKGYARKYKIPDSHSFAHHTEATIALFKMLINKYPYKNKRIDGNERDNWGIKKRGITVLDPNGLCPTLTTHPDDYVHYCEPRILTVREYARIQTFPDWYEIKSKYTTGGKLRKVEVPRYTQIGNAIPPLFAELAGVVLKELL